MALDIISLVLQVKNYIFNKFFNNYFLNFILITLSFEMISVFHKFIYI